jgi:hypothetical protein
MLFVEAELERDPEDRDPLPPELPPELPPNRLEFCAKTLLSAITASTTAAITTTVRNMDFTPSPAARTAPGHTV